MEDSGIDSEDKQSTNCDDLQMVNSDGSNAVTSHMDDLDVVFRGNKDVNYTQPRSRDERDVTIENASTDAGDGGRADVQNRQTQPPNTCRILQRKLELKVERAKRNYSQYQEDNAKKSQAANLIPISRLTIPGDSEHKPLVDYQTDSSEPEEISFFPTKIKSQKLRHKNPELSDTFSIQEMTIDSDLDSDDSGGSSQNLELLPPMVKKTAIEKLLCCLGCFNRHTRDS